MKKYIILVLILLLQFDKVYSKELIDMGYNYINEGINNYYYDKEDYIINYTDWQNYNNEELENIEVKTFYKYNKVLPIRYIHIYDGGIGTGKLKISELKILNGLEEINYEKKCSYCRDDTLNYLNDNIYDFNKLFIMDYKFGYLIIDLLNEYELENLNVKIYLNDDTSLLKKYNIGFSITDEKDSFVTTKYFEEDVYSYKRDVMYEYSVDDNWNINYNFVKEYESDELVENNIFYQKISEQQKYRLYDFKYKTYMIDKEEKEVDEKQEYNQQPKIENEPTLTNIQPTIKTINIENNNTIETKNDMEEIKESSIEIIENNKNKLIYNQHHSYFLLITYILIIILILIILIIINCKKLSYEK